MDEIDKLEKFIQEEKARAHQVAEGINRKMIEAEKRRENLVEMKKQLKSDIKKRNQEMAAKAGKKAEDMKQGDMADYEAKQALIAEKERAKKKEREALNKQKE